MNTVEFSTITNGFNVDKQLRLVFGNILNKKYISL